MDWFGMAVRFFAVVGFVQTGVLFAGIAWLLWDERRLQRILDAHFDEIGAD